MARNSSRNNSNDNTSPSDELYELVIGNIQELFVDQLDAPYVRMTIDNKSIVLRTKDKKLSNYLHILFKKKFGKLPKRDTVKSVIEQLTAEAELSGIMHSLELRINKHGDCIYYDLANDKYEVVKIMPNKYEIVTDYPIILTRNKNSVAQTRPLLNISDTSEYFLLLAKHFRFRNENDQFLFGIANVI